MRRPAASLLVAALAAAPLLHAPAALAARAPTPNEKALAGRWRIESEDGKRRCAVVLTSKPIPAGLVVEQPTPCADPYFGIARVAAWKVERGDLVLVTITGAVAARFRQEGGLFASLTAPPSILRPIEKERST